MAGCPLRGLGAERSLSLSVIGDFNALGLQRPTRCRLARGFGRTGKAFLPGVRAGHERTSTRSPREYGDYEVDKADPYAFAAEPRPKTASVVADLSAHSWNDARMDGRIDPGEQRPRGADLDLRGPSRLVDARRGATAG